MIGTTVARVPFSLLIVALATIGCQRKGNVSGIVTFEGKPVVFGTVLVEASDGSIKQSNISPEGKYSIEGLPTGSIRVAVNSPNPKSNAFVPIRGEGKPPDAPGWFPIPERYGDVGTSGLSYAIKGGENTIQVELN